MEKISAEYNIPSIVLGDFNSALNSLCLSRVFERGRKETHDICIGERDDTNGYHFCFPAGFRHDEPEDYSKAIDHIIAFDTEKIQVNRFLRHTPLYFDKLSDHFTVYIDLDL